MREKIGTQCRNVVYCKPPTGLDYDYHFVKYTDYYSDGTKENKVALKKDYEKTFWVCSKGNRNHKQKKERFPLEKLEEVKATRLEMVNKTKRALGIKFGTKMENGQDAVIHTGNKFSSDRDLLRGPYVFGMDLSSTAELKYKYNQQPLAKKTEQLADVAAFDVETNIRDKSRWEWIEMATLSIKGTCITVVDFHFIQEKFPRITKEEALEKLYKYDEIYLGNINKERNIKQEFYIVDNEWQVLETIFKRAHEIKPDFISAWNMDYDISRSLECCARFGKDPKDLFSDPIVPEEFRFFKYNPGKEAGLSKKGVFKSYANFEKWPQVHCPSSFVFADSMCFYYNSRKHLGKEPSYKLDYILEKEFPKKEYIRKLKFDETKHLAGTIEWHLAMQTQYPFEYIIYNKFDCIALEYLDEQTLDLCSSLPSAVATGDYQDYESEPKRLANEMHWFNLERGYAYGNGGQDNVIELDKELIGRDDWIITLRADLLVEPGMNLMEDAPCLFTNIHEDNGDIDVTSSYPSSNAAMNTSRETLSKELISIDGVDEIDRRQCGINFSGGFVNAVEISTKLFALPEMSDVLREFDQDMS